MVHFYCRITDLCNNASLKCTNAKYSHTTWLMMAAG